MTRVWIVKTGATVPPLVPRRGDFEDWFRAGLGLDPQQTPLVCPYRDDGLPEPDAVDACVVTGSPAMVTERAEWSEATSGFLRQLVKRGAWVLGICYGHQLLAEALGGQAGWNPRGREIGSVAVELLPAACDDPLVGGWSSPLVVQTSHSQSVTRLPPGAVGLARNAHDPHQGFRFGERAWGFQFHPEFDADITRDYLEYRRTTLEGEGLSVDELVAELRDDEAGRAAAILHRFAAITRRDA